MNDRDKYQNHSKSRMFDALRRCITKGGTPLQLYTRLGRMLSDRDERARCKNLCLEELTHDECIVLEDQGLIEDGYCERRYEQESGS